MKNSNQTTSWARWCVLYLSEKKVYLKQELSGVVVAVVVNCKEFGFGGEKRKKILEEQAGGHHHRHNVKDNKYAICSSASNEVECNLLSSRV